MRELKGHEYGGQVGGMQVPREVIIQRLNDTTTYAAGDVWGNYSSTPVLKDCAREGQQSGYIHGIRVTENDTSGVPLDFRLWLFKRPIDVSADNTAFTLEFAEAIDRVCVIDSATAQLEVAKTGLVTWDFHDIIVSFDCQEGSRDLYPVIEVTNLNEPVALGMIHIAIEVGQN